MQQASSFPQHHIPVHMLAETGEMQQHGVGTHGALDHIRGVCGADGDADEETKVARLTATPAGLPDPESGRFGELPLEATVEGGSGGS